MSAEAASSAAPAKPWREQLQTLKTHLISERYGKASSLSLRLLQSSENDDYADDPIPEGVCATLRTIHARCLIRRGSQYEELIEFCRSQSRSRSSSKEEKGESLALEEAYGLYRTKRYVDCRDLCAKALSSSATDDGGDGEGAASSAVVVGLRHLKCQASYRLHETENASRSYEELLASRAEEEDDERDETITNLLATSIANATRSGSSADDRLLKLAEERLGSDGSNGDNYDLAYNLGTYKLLTANSTSELRGALSVLIDAERTCLKVLTEDDDEVSEGEIDAEAGPIRCNVALGKLLMGTVAGTEEATRAYEKISTLAGNAGGSKVAAGNNLAVSKVGKESLFDSLKRLPNVSGAGTGDAAGRENGGENGGGGAGGSSSTGAATLFTPHQVRSVLFNRSLFLLRMNKFSECREALEALRVAVTTSGGGAQKAGKRKKKKKKKATAAALEAAGTNAADAAVVPPAPPASDAERILWLNAIDTVESEVLEREGKSADAKKLLDDARTRVESALTTTKDDGERRTLEYALAELILYDRERGRRGSSSAEEDNDDVAGDIEALEQLPRSVRSRPAIVATLSSLYESAGRTEDASALLAHFHKGAGGNDGEGEGGESKEALLASAARKASSGLYEDAAEMYEKALDRMGDDDDDERTDVTARLVVALSRFDPDRAEEFAASLPSLVDEGDEDEEAVAVIDGEELEAMEVPRFFASKGRTRKLIAGDGGIRGGVGRDGSKEKQKKNHESVLRQRAKRRELYLSELEKLGKYDPSRPSKPDPERWIPKNQRSYAKRGRRGRHKFAGAQGGGSGAGAEKDAAKLDVAARKKAVEAGEGAGGGSSKPSTAHMGVSSGGGGKRRGGRR